MFDEILAYIHSHDFLYAIIIVILFFVVAKSITFVLKKILHRYYRIHKVRNQERHYMDDIQVMIGILIVLFGFQYLSYMTIISHTIYDSTVLTMIVIIVTYIVTELGELVVSTWGHKDKSEEFTTEVMPLVRGVVKIIFVIVAFIIVLGIWGVPILSLVTSVGVISVVLGLALQDTLKNIFGGIALIADDSFRVTDVIKIPSGDYANEIGEVMQIGLRSTQIKTYDAQILMIPNGALANQSIINYARPSKEIRVMLPVSVAYGSDHHKVEQVLLECVKGKQEIVKHPRPQARFEEMGDYALKFSLVFYIQNYRHMFTLRSKMNGVIYETLKKNNIEIPFPTQKIYFEKN